MKRIKTVKGFEVYEEGDINLHIPIGLMDTHGSHGFLVQTGPGEFMAISIDGNTLNRYHNIIYTSLNAQCLLDVFTVFKFKNITLLFKWVLKQKKS